ncbi:MAG: ATPase, T2SS/T4P/T4SS family [Spirochaetia bacterium]|nr:ATPase, T2SS/T4P/T4SS family [Spirochaetota bacterium]MDW8113113.1 ATPase, T2SS/T4P/T4SS family [Spirochaetia bacterium]
MALGDVLVEMGIITKEELSSYLQKQKITNKKLGQILLEEGKIEENQLYELLSKQFNIKFETTLPLPTVEKSQILLSLVPIEFCKRKLVAPLDVRDDFIVVAIDNPSDFDLISEIRFITGRHVETRFSTATAIKNYLNDLQNLVSGRLVERRDVLESIVMGSQTKTDREESKKDESKVVGLVNKIIAEGIERKSSDIHLEVYENRVVLRYRIDGRLYNFEGPQLNLYPAVVSRIKIMSNLDISERRLPQDGAIKFLYNGRDIDIRVSIIPGIYGENVVMRILQKDTNIISDLSAIGMDSREVEIYKKALSRPNGMILVTGPTGSGKTTTLYAGINYLKEFNKKIITAEDPVEYQIDGIEQIQVNPEIGFTFASALRSFLRHDPDVIMVGEIRDTETAEIAIRSALTGHLVLSTLHTNDAPSSITRLIDMGIPPYLVASTLNLVIAQRLVRKLCDNCKSFKDISSVDLSEEIRKYFKGNDKIPVHQGCVKCGKTGFSGRIPIFEMLVLNEEIKSAILKNMSSFELRRIAIETGMKTLLDAGMEKVRKGITTIEEVISVS